MGWLDDVTIEFVESGCALIIGSVSPGGEPRAGRGWGLTVLPDPRHVRLLLDGADPETALDLAVGAPIAITAASITTLEAVQLKGRIVEIPPVTPADLERADRYCVAMFTDIHETDSTPMSLLEELRPSRYQPCIVEVADRFDQTPGPGAGARVVGP